MPTIDKDVMKSQHLAFYSVRCSADYQRPRFCVVAREVGTNAIVGSHACPTHLAQLTAFAKDDGWSEAERAANQAAAGTKRLLRVIEGGKS